MAACSRRHGSARVRGASGHRPACRRRRASLAGDGHLSESSVRAIYPNHLSESSFPSRRECPSASSLLIAPGHRHPSLRVAGPPTARAVAVTVQRPSIRVAHIRRRRSRRRCSDRRPSTPARRRVPAPARRSALLSPPRLGWTTRIATRTNDSEEVTRSRRRPGVAALPGAGSRRPGARLRYLAHANGGGTRARPRTPSRPSESFIRGVHPNCPRAGRRSESCRRCRRGRGARRPSFSGSSLRVYPGIRVAGRLSGSLSGYPSRPSRPRRAPSLSDRVRARHRESSAGPGRLG